jgi:hypothetical protein
MTRYFFKVRCEHQTHQRARGEELPDNDAAWRKAKSIAGKFLRDSKLKPGEECEIEVTDELKHRLYVISINSHEFASVPAIATAANACEPPNSIVLPIEVEPEPG